MSVKPIPDESPRVTPYLYYRDVGAALGFLSEAFGLEEFGKRFKDPSGYVNHAAVKIGDGQIMMGCPDPNCENPKTLGHATQGLYVYVEDVDRHFERAKAAGATILKEPEDQFYGDRRYDAEDPEGHHWTFAQHVRDVDFDQMEPGS